MTGSARRIRSPSRVSVRRRTPCVAGCCGPMLSTMSLVARLPVETVSSRGSVVTPGSLSCGCEPAAGLGRWPPQGANQSTGVSVVRRLRMLASAALLATAMGVLAAPAGASQPPSTPVLSKVTPGDTQVSVDWQPSPSSAPDTLDYVVDVRTMADNLVTETSTAQTSYTATGLTNGT